MSVYVVIRAIVKDGPTLWDISHESHFQGVYSSIEKAIRDTQEKVSKPLCTEAECLEEFEQKGECSIHEYDRDIGILSDAYYITEEVVA